MGHTADFFSVVLMLTLVQNIVLARGAGAAHLLWQDGSWQGIYLHGGLISSYSLILMTAFWFLGDLALAEGFIYMVIMTVVLMIVLYLMSALLVKLIIKPAHNRLYKIIALAAFNSTLFYLPFLRSVSGQNLPVSLGIAVGAGAGVILADLICASGFKRLEHPDVPKAFRGMPARLLFVGILCLPIAGFSINYG